MKRIVLSLISFLLLISISPSYSLAQDSVSSEEVIESDHNGELMIEDGAMMENDEMMMEQVNSFELFWPVVAGKVKGDKLYFLKRLKEKVRGLLIFGDAKDADYNIFLATKRAVEAEKLINANDYDNARETLENAIENIDEASEEWSDAEGENTNAKHEMNNKLANLETFLPYLSTTVEDESITKLIDSLLSDIQDLDDKI